jgi:hypothetical protein
MKRELPHWAQCQAEIRQELERELREEREAEEREER